ncbi:dihydrouridine synthase-domain-containing protein [Mycotypha africana]|uniref:dihydrouridine synthase-domain-containing protein n=1 Tax=Mycotypha africana TaxID=64632 RepID=UPI0022FFCEFF|nr:dihydrouridine synthase-domain-containing protein [Mycotypha africana]KAI8971855.1 dihydrouridine synthase-domain-containing protein [Mycotypha africana]
MSPVKLEGYEFFNKTLKSPKTILAPMVDQSELAFRILTKRYGCDVCFTPMLHARLFSESKKYRDEFFTTNKEDRPLVVQFCANDPDILLNAAKLVEDDCDAVDLNLGCPQHIAKRGFYGSYLQDEWELIAKMVSLLHKELAVPVTVKIRCFSSVEKTVEYAKMIEAAGAQMLTVHGRLREQKGHNTGLADWTKIKAVKEAVKIPVVANGNILYYEDFQRCMDFTGCDAVMTAEGSLYNPAIFSKDMKLPPLAIDMAQEYLDICKDVKTIGSAIKGHLFKILHSTLPHHTEMRARLGKARTLDEYDSIVKDLRVAVMKDIEEKGEGEDVQGQADENGIRKYAYWRCQPYFRPKLPANNGNNNNNQQQVKKRTGETKENDNSKKVKQDSQKEEENVAKLDAIPLSAAATNTTGTTTTPTEN